MSTDYATPTAGKDHKATHVTPSPNKLFSSGKSAALLPFGGKSAIDGKSLYSPLHPSMFCQLVSFTPDKILLPGEKGQPMIDIMPIFCKEPDDIFAHLKDSLKQIILPPSVYHPSWHQRDHVMNHIIRACYNHANTQLIIESHNSSKNAKHVNLRCKFGRTFYSRDLNEREVTYNVNRNTPAQYKDGIKEDRMVNKQKSSRGEAGRSMAKRTNTEKPPKDDKCKFRIRVTLIPGKHWCMKTCSTELKCHNHFLLDRDQMTRPLKHLTLKERRYMHVYQRMAGGSAGRNILHALNDGCQFSAQQFHYNMQKMTGQHRTKKEGGPKSAASLLMEELKALQEHNEVNHVALYHKITDSSLLAIRKSQLHAQLLQTQDLASKHVKRLMHAADGAVTRSRAMKEALAKEEQVAKDIEDLESDPELMKAQLCLQMDLQKDGVSPESHALKTAVDKLALGSSLNTIMSHLKVDAGQKILIGVAWATQRERRMFDLFPEILQIDVTHQTNREGRPLAVTCSFDGNREVFTPVRAFLPSECKWVFNWLFAEAIPTLLGKEALRRTQLVLSDGDPKIYLSFDANQAELYPNAKHALCLYHLVNQGTERLSVKLMHSRDGETKAMLQYFNNWIYTWSKLGGVETYAEFLQSRDLLKKWLSDVQKHPKNTVAARHNAVVLHDHLEKCILIHESRILLCLRGRRLTLDQRTTSALEGVNHTIKVKSAKTTKPSMSLLESFRTQLDQCRDRLRRWWKNIGQAANSRALWVWNSPTADHVVTVCESFIQQKSAQADNYASRPLDKGTIEVVRKPDTAPAFCSKCTGDVVCNDCELSPIAMFARRRRITFTRVDDWHYTVECTCLDYWVTGIPCVHFCHLQKINPGHVHVRWHTGYPAHFGVPLHESQTLHYASRRMDRRLIVTTNEYSSMMAAAMASEKTTDATVYQQEILRGTDSRCFQKSQSGLLHSFSVADKPAIGLGSNSLLMSQEIALTEDAVKPPVSMGKPYITGNSYTDKCAKISALIRSTEESSELRNDLECEFQIFISKMENRILSTLKTPADSCGEYVSLCPNVGGPGKHKRKKASSERSRPRKAQKKMALVLTDSLVDS